MLDKFFKISERGSTVSNEVIGGLTTFLAMAYIIAVNPAMMEAAGIPFNAALTATCFGAAIMTVAMGLFANRPIALASGMGINAIVAYSLCLGLGVDWRVAMAVVFLEGILILLLVLCGLRKAVMDAIPVSLRRAIGIGIGLFIAFIGLKGGGFIAADESTFLALGDLTSPTAIVAAISIIVAVVLTAVNLKGALLISIVAATIIGDVYKRQYPAWPYASPSHCRAGSSDSGSPSSARPCSPSWPAWLSPCSGSSPRAAACRPASRSAARRCCRLPSCCWASG